jgi:hypothetical protein
MNQDEADDAFLYGETDTGATGQTAPSAGVPLPSADQDMEQASEGEVEDEEDEDESDSV